MPDVLYHREGGLWLPTEWTGSPWSDTTQHGGALNALFMHAAEEAASEGGLHVARLTVDLYKPVPREPLALAWRYLRRGRRLAVVEASLAAPGGAAPCCSARAVLLAPSAGPAPAWETPSQQPPGPAGVEEVPFLPRDYRETVPPGFHLSIEVRLTEDDAGPAAWITTPLELSEGEAMTPLQRCAAVSDLTFGLSARMLLRRRLVDVGAPRRSLINTDTSLHLERPAEGSWFAFRHAFLTERDGVGLAEVTLHDERGRLGRAVQTLSAMG